MSPTITALLKRLRPVIADRVRHESGRPGDNLHHEMLDDLDRVIRDGEASAAKGGTEDIAVIRQAAAAGRFRIRCKDRPEGGDREAGMVWPIEIELPCINGLSCWFTIGSLYSPDAAAQGYTDGLLSDDLTRAFAAHITRSIASPPPPARDDAEAR